MSNQPHELSDAAMTKKAIGYASVFYEALRSPGEADDESRLRQKLDALKFGLGDFSVPVFRQDVPGDVVTKAIHDSAQEAANQVATAWSRLAEMLAGLLARFAIDAEDKASDVIDFPGFLQRIALSPALHEEDDSSESS